MSRSLALSILVSLLLLPRGDALGQLDYEQEPILYGKRATRDPIARLQTRIDQGEVELVFDEERGYLPTVLKHLGVSPSSQVLVFSKTSFQLRRITPQRPRALYYDDTTYIGWVQGGDMLEIMTTDPQQGAIFYTIPQTEEAAPRFQRDRGQCMVCHSSSKTQGVPGGVVRSVFVGPTGQPHYGSGTFSIDHRIPFKQRWGGWYVSGTHGDMRHMGNVVSRDRLRAEQIDREVGANVSDLSTLLDVEPYLTPHSDIVSLMVLEHQTQMQNYLTRANYESRSSAHYDKVMNASLERPADHISDTTTRRIASTGDKLLRYLLMKDEFPLTSAVRGSSDFAEEFQVIGPRDSQGRSLRDLDLQTRLFKYPCSYLIYSPSFRELPKPMKQYVVKRLRNILQGEEETEEFAHLTASDRKAIFEILTETIPGFWEP